MIAGTVKSILLRQSFLKLEHWRIDNLLHHGLCHDLRHGIVDHLLHTLKRWHIDVLFDAPSHLHCRVNRGSRGDLCCDEQQLPRNMRAAEEASRSAMCQSRTRNHNAKLGTVETNPQHISTPGGRNQSLWSTWRRLPKNRTTMTVYVPWRKTGTRTEEMQCVVHQLYEKSVAELCR